MSVLIFTSIAARIPSEGGAILQTRGGLVFTLDLPAGPARHRLGRLRRAGPAPHPGPVREAHGRPAHVRRHLDLPAAEGQPGRRHPGHLRLVAALPAAADHPAPGQRHRPGPSLLRQLRRQPGQLGPHPPVLRADRVLHVLLRVDHLQPGGACRRHEEATAASSPASAPAGPPRSTCSTSCPGSRFPGSIYLGSWPSCRTCSCRSRSRGRTRTSRSAAPRC